MSLPDPVPGLVIRYSYLWKAEYGRGQEEGVKDRPCAVILVSADEDGDRMVTVLPISHTPPADPELAVELPAATKRRLGLDDERSWVVLTEANRFPAQALLAPNPTGEPTLRRKGPGPDLRPARPGTLQASPMDCCRLGYSKPSGSNSSPRSGRAAPESCRAAHDRCRRR